MKRSSRGNAVTDTDPTPMSESERVDGASWVFGLFIGLAFMLALVLVLLTQCGPGFVDSDCSAPSRLYEPDGSYVLTYECEAPR